MPPARASGARRIRASATARDARAERLFTLPVLVESRDGYRNLCRLVTTDEAARAERGRGADARRSRRPRRRARRARRAHGDRRRAVRRRRPRRSPRRHVRRAERLRRAAAPPAARRGMRTTMRCAISPRAFHLPVVATNGVRFAEPADRPLYDVLTCIRHKTTLERAGRRLTCERRALPEDAGGDGAAVRRPAGGDRRHRRARRSPRLHDGRSRLPLSRVSGAGRARRWRRSCGRSRRRARASATGRIDDRAAAADRARAGSDREARSRRLLPDRLGHRELLPPAATSSCRDADRRPTAPSATASASPRSIRSAWTCCSSGFSRRSAASGRTSISICRAAIGASASSSTSTRSTASSAPAMTANVITYRGRSAAREVGKALSLEPRQIDRLAKVMNHFEWVDPKETLERNLREVGHRRPASDDSAVRPALAADPGSAAPSRPAFRRHGDLPGPARRGRAARKREHARPRRHPVGQGRLRRHGDRQGRSARPRHDGGAAGCAGAGE